MSNLAINYNKVAALPQAVRPFCFSNEAWIVGSAATWLLDLKDDEPRDYDLLVPFWTWGVACRSIPEGSRTNSHGGVKIITDGAAIDLWAGDIGWFLAQVPSTPTYAVHPKSMTYLVAGRERVRVKSETGWKKRFLGKYNMLPKIEIDTESYLRP